MQIVQLKIDCSDFSPVHDKAIYPTSMTQLMSFMEEITKCDWNVTNVGTQESSAVKNVWVYNKKYRSVLLFSKYLQ